MRFVRPIDGVLTRGWSFESSIYIGGQHAAGDYAPYVLSAPIKSTAEGDIIGVGWDFYSGFFVSVDHGDFTSTYRHMFGQSPIVVGQYVIQGQVIGNVGNTGWSLGDHLHFDLWSKNPIEGAFQKHGIWAVDPELYLGIEEEEGMTNEQMQQILNAMQGHATYTQNLIREQADRTRSDLAGHQTFTQNLIRQRSDVVLKAIGKIEASDGATSDEVKEAVKDALREGVD